MMCYCGAVGAVVVLCCVQWWFCGTIEVKACGAVVGIESFGGGATVLYGCEAVDVFVVLLVWYSVRWCW